MSEPSVPTVATYAAAGTTMAASFTASEIGVYGGLLVAVCTFLMNWYYKRLERKDRLDAQRKASGSSPSD